MIFRYANEQDYEAVRALWIEGFGDEVPAYNDWYFREVYKPERTICCIDNDQMTACLQIAPYHLRLNGQTVPVAYLVGVVTGEQYRHRGYGHALLKHTFTELKKDGIQMAMLYTDIPIFYEPVGFVHCYTHKKAEILPEQTSPVQNWSQVTDMDAFITKAAPTYDSMTADLDGFVIRTRENWKTFLGDYYNAGGGMWVSDDAYFVWAPEDGYVLIRELGYTDPKAMEDALSRIKLLLLEIGEKKAIWNAPLSAPVECSENVPFAMCRRVDLPKTVSAEEAASQTQELYSMDQRVIWVNEMT